MSTRRSRRSEAVPSSRPSFGRSGSRGTRTCRRPWWLIAGSWWPCDRKPDRAGARAENHHPISRRNSLAKTIFTGRHGRTTIVTIDRPERRNAIDLPTAQALIAAFEAFDADEASHVAVLTGAGGAFCAGADLVAIAAGERKPLNRAGTFAPIGPTRLKLSKPVIAAIEGPAVAGGMELAAWCDLRVAGRSALFGMYNRRFGVPTCDLGAIRFPRLIGQGRALDLMLTGRTVGMDEALAIGLVSRVVDDGAALSAALALAEDIGSVPQVAMRNDRKALIDSWDLSEADAIANEIELGLATLGSGETVAGASSFAGGAGRHGAAVGR
ncbi:crotonase/enoyl-CoA hydratase family protein [Phreatobacter stygius]|uniref:Crotonase/enoyl-CoA hydratase family protein n=1 Tax=Phreatobacter stygius TaxID=1940610 RepID=A0A4D7BEU6_9HYPH|nr:crotonase/enoyl-CoA hydratase family protein [Phreatobacter stygius]